MSDPLRVGSRASVLALRQTEMAVRLLHGRVPRFAFEIVAMTTHGDRDRRPGASPDFTGTLEEALRRREIDLAVHSAKDLTADEAPGLVIAAYPPRADPRDCIVARASGPLAHRARVGTSSLRRRAQLLRWRADLRLTEIRGNVDTRIRLVRDRALDAIVVAKAGLDRLGRASEVSEILPSHRFLPAPGQGALALQVRREDRKLRAIARAVDHAPTRAAVEAERALASGLGASCDVPLGALARARGETLHLIAEVLSTDGARSVRASRVGPAERARVVGRRVARTLEAMGARSLFPRTR